MVPVSNRLAATEAGDGGDHSAIAEVDLRYCHALLPEDHVRIEIDGLGLGHYRGGFCRREGRQESVSHPSMLGRTATACCTVTDLTRYKRALFRGLRGVAADRGLQSQRSN